MEHRIPLLSGTIYHIYNHANGSDNLYRTDENYRYFLKKYAEYIHPIAHTFAYCLMPNHFHVMVQIREKNDLVEFFTERNKIPAGADLRDFGDLGDLLDKLISKQFSHLFNGYAKAYNRMFNRRGSLFMPRFKRKAIEDDTYFAQLLVYIHLNPVKHGFCTHFLEWEHSSIHAYYNNKPSKLNLDFPTNWFGNRQALLSFHEQSTPNDQSFEFR